MFAYSFLRAPGVQVVDRGLIVGNGAALVGWLGRLPRGGYVLTMQFEIPISRSSEGLDVASVNVTEGDTQIAHTSVRVGSREIRLELQSAGTEPIELGLDSETPALVITGAQLRRMP